MALITLPSAVRGRLTCMQHRSVMLPKEAGACTTSAVVRQGADDVAERRQGQVDMHATQVSHAARIGRRKRHLRGGPPGR